MLDRIGIGEHVGRPVSYDTTFGYGAFVPEGSKRVTEMTLDEVAALQKGMLALQRGRRGTPSSSAGKYQFNIPTLARLRQKLDLTGSDVLTPGIQDRLARELLEERGYGDFISGKIDARTFQGNIAPIWPSVARVATGTAPSGQHLGTTTDEMQAALDQAKAEADDIVSSFNVDPYERGWR